jgi:hypothetical protein
MDSVCMFVVSGVATDEQEEWHPLKKIKKF